MTSGTSTQSRQLSLRCLAASTTSTCSAPPRGLTTARAGCKQDVLRHGLCACAATRSCSVPEQRCHGGERSWLCVVFVTTVCRHDLPGKAGYGVAINRNSPPLGYVVYDCAGRCEGEQRCKPSGSVLDLASPTVLSQPSVVSLPEGIAPFRGGGHLDHI